MAVVIRATVIDIRTDIPLVDDSFIVDTNIWLWLLYPPLTLNSSGRPKQQATDYPTYFKQALNAKSKLHTTGLIMSELAHNIERTQRDIYNANLASPLETKEYRHDYPRQRSSVTSLIESVWNDVLSSSILLEIGLTKAFISNAMSGLKTSELDGYDVFTAELAKQTGITQIITDDGDFATVPGITIYTTNHKILTLAHHAGKLSTR